jgi:hypothetical protein
MLTNSTRTALLDELLFAQLVKIFTTIMEPEYLLVYSQQHAVRILS